MAREPKWLRETGRILSSLLQASDDELADFVRERLRGAEVEAERVADAREILLHVGEALRAPTAERLMSLEQTRRLLQSWQVEPGLPEDSLAGAVEPRGSQVAPTADTASAALGASAGAVPLPSAHGPPSSPPAMPSGPSPIARASAEPRGPSPWTGVSSQPPPPAPAMAPPAMAPPPVIVSEAPGSLAAAAPSPAVPPSDPMAMTTTASAPGAPLPFETGKRAIPQKFSLEPHAAMGQTAPLARKPKNPTTPFKAISSLEVIDRAPALTLEQYAYFCTERALWPNHRAETCAKYGLDEAAEDAVHAHYRDAFAADPVAKSRFNEVRAHARRQLGG